MLQSHSLSDSLRDYWNKYEKKVYLSRKTTSTQNIHQLRISTQKLEAVLSLTDDVHSSRLSRKSINLIRDIRKAFGPLRDFQVESEALGIKGKKQSHSCDPNFVSYINERERRAKIKLIKCLEKISLKREKRKVGKLIEKITAAENQTEPQEIQDHLDDKMRSNVAQFNKFIKRANPLRPKEIHRTRILAKAIRYQQECLNTISGDSRYNLEDLKKVLLVAGKIRNDSILLGTLDKYLKKKKHGEDRMILDLRNRVVASQKKLINNDFKRLSHLKLEELQ